MIRRPPRSTRKESSAASDVYKRQLYEGITGKKVEDKKLYPIAAVVIIVFVFLGITAFYLDITQPIKL